MNQLLNLAQYVTQLFGESGAFRSRTLQHLDSPFRSSRQHDQHADDHRDQ
jgi:hypothetical protein